MRRQLSVLVAVSSLALASALPAKPARTPEQVAMAALAAAPVWDGHNDVPEQVRDRRKDVLGDFDFRDTTRELGMDKWNAGGGSGKPDPMQTDLPRLGAGPGGAPLL